LEYIHNNPVSRGLCRRAVDWKWSSARYYLDVPPRQQRPKLPVIHGLPEGTIVSEQAERTLAKPVAHFNSATQPDRRKALRRHVMEHELSTLAAIRRLPRKIIQLTKRLMSLAV
jgi:hypothetical protein